jgi:hypothetical protein
MIEFLQEETAACIEMEWLTSTPSDSTPSYFQWKIMLSCTVNHNIFGELNVCKNILLWFRVDYTYDIEMLEIIRFLIFAIISEIQFQIEKSPRLWWLCKKNIWGPSTNKSFCKQFLFIDGFFCKIIKTRWYFYLNFLFQKNRTKNKVIRAKNWNLHVISNNTIISTNGRFPNDKNLGVLFLQWIPCKNLMVYSKLFKGLPSVVDITIPWCLGLDVWQEEAMSSEINNDRYYLPLYWLETALCVHWGPRSLRPSS